MGLELNETLIQMTRILEVLVVTLITLSFSQYSEDSCDWIIWDSAEDVDGVRTIHPTCSEGFVQWKQPYGAIRVSFSQNTPNFDLCFIAKSTKMTVKISQEEDDGLRHLTSLVDNNNKNSGGDRYEDSGGGTSSKEICLQSNSQHAIVIYIETVLDTTSSSAGGFILHYDIRHHLTSPVEKSGMQECRPCTDEELVQAVCYSDFVVRGKIEQVHHSPEVEESQVYVTLDKIYRQIHDVFKQNSVLKKGHQQIENSYSDGNTINKLKSSVRNKSTDSSSLVETSRKLLFYKGQVVVPHKCRTSRGDGTFIFIGKVRLKRAHLQCAPRFNDFERIWKDAIRMGANICVLG